MVTRGTLLVFLCASAPGADPAFVGAQSCGACHAEQLRTQSATAHARALYPAEQHPLSAEFAPNESFARSPDFDFRFVREDRGILIRVANSTSALVLGLDWAFGSGEQGVTFVSKAGPDTYLEDYLSYFTRSRAMGKTPGQETSAARDVLSAAGSPHTALDIVSCFMCHSTGTVKVVGDRVEPHELGVRCEACHGPGSNHVATDGAAPIRNPGKLSAVGLVEMCGRCHRGPVPLDRSADWEDPWNVRFAPAYLSRSNCFLKSGGKLSCTTCHTSHQALRRNDPVRYNNVCANCHPSAHLNTAKAANCIDCHMPRVWPRPELAFTNHRIGVYNASKVQPIAVERAR